MADTLLKSTCKYVILPRGVKLYTERWHAGVERPSQTIVCIHGMGSTSATFSPFVAPLLALLPTAHVLLYDWVGSGKSPLPQALSGTGHTVADHVADLDALVAAEVPTGEVALVAHSAGTVLAARWLPTTFRISRVVFLGGPIDPPLPAGVTAMQQAMADNVAAGGPEAVVDSITSMLLGPTSVAARPGVVDAFRAITLAQSAEGYAAAIRAFSRDLSAEGERIDWAAVQAKKEVLVVNGEEDGMVGSTDFVDKAKVVKVPGAGHTLTLEAPEATAKIVADFLGDK